MVPAAPSHTIPVMCPGVCSATHWNGSALYVHCWMQYCGVFVRNVKLARMPLSLAPCPVAITATGGGVVAPAEWSMSSKLIDIVSWTSMFTTASLSQPLTDDVAWTCQAPSRE